MKPLYRSNPTRILLLASFIFLGVGCAVHTRVYGYADVPQIDTAGKYILVFEKPRADNPFVEAGIATKLKSALRINGSIPVKKLEASDYVIIFYYGIDQGQVYTKTYSRTWGDLNIYSGKLENRTKVFSSRETEYSRYLKLEMYKVKGLNPKSKPIWIGETFSKGSSSDLRLVIDYLIVSAFEHFGENTNGEKRYIIFPEDKRVRNLNSSLYLQ